MKDTELLSLLQSQVSDGITIAPLNGGFKISLPFTDSMGDRIEIGVSLTDSEFLIDDLGHTAGLLFQLGQSGEESVGHQLIRNLCQVYDIDIDYNQGVLLKRISVNKSARILDFVKVLTSIKTILPVMPYHKRERRTGRRLGTLLGQQVKQLRLPNLVSRETEVDGKNETWVVDYRYVVRVNGEHKDIMIVTTDLQWGDPRGKAAHVVTLAMDVLGLGDKRDLRIIYDVGQNGNILATRRAASLIEDNRTRIGYKTYDYSDSERRQALLSLLHQELSPLSWLRGQR